MPAPLVAAGMYFGLPRLLGALAEQAAMSRAQSLSSQGVDPSNDALINLLGLVPNRSGLESTVDALRTIDYYRNTPFSTSSPLEESPPGAQVTRELPYGQGVEFLSPMDDFLRYGGRDDDSGEAFPYANQSYGQTSQPATEVSFGSPQGGARGSGFAGGGLADLIRMMHAQRQR